jgi:NAD-dependent SIR2 family protein deacetylase
MYAHKSKDARKEFFDSDAELDTKVTFLADLILSSKHVVVFTGAGISTGAGIADFRSGVNTVLETGPGIWEIQATKVKTKPKKEVDMLQAIPTPAHMALVKLEELGLIKYLISQNIDGLHRKSGIPSNKLAELHGNTNLEKCRNPMCEKQYLRDYDTVSDNDDHSTTNKCENCGQILYDSIIHFEEQLPQDDLANSFFHGKKADLIIVLDHR